MTAKDEQQREAKRIALGWPPGYFERTAGSLSDDPIKRAPQCMYCDDDLIDEPINTKPLAHYKRVIRIEGCTCGHAVMVSKWVKQEDDDES